MSIKIMMIYDQIQAGAGTKDDKMVPLSAKKEPIGPAIMMEPSLKKIDGRVIACIYCGNGTYLANADEVSRKICAMVNKVQPDVVMCGPAFNFIDYASMAARIAYDINQTTNVPAFAAMSIENEDTISKYKDKVNIVVTPKKGGTGLNDSLNNMCQLAGALVAKDDVTSLTNRICF
jgi:glycine/betaine/sarcosine/D-proline reductase family selenoprotein B